MSTPETKKAAKSVVVAFKATGDAPRLKQEKYKIGAHESYKKVVTFLCERLGRDSVHTYLNQAFTPSMDENVETLLESYGLDGKLMVNYSITPAWG